MLLATRFAPSKSLGNHREFDDVKDIPFHWFSQQIHIAVQPWECRRFGPNDELLREFGQTDQLQYLQLRLFRLRNEHRKAIWKESLCGYWCSVACSKDKVRNQPWEYHPLRSEHWNGTYSGPGQSIWGRNSYIFKIKMVNNEKFKLILNISLQFIKFYAWFWSYSIFEFNYFISLFLIFLRSFSIFICDILWKLYKLLYQLKSFPILCPRENRPYPPKPKAYN